MNMNKALIYGLLLSILMVIAPHAAHLPPWVSALCAVLLLWRAYLTWSGGHDTLLAKRADCGNDRPVAPPAPKGSAPPCRSDNPLPKRWLLLAITFASMGGILISFHTLFGREVGVTLLILLTALKFMELRSPRDAMVLVYLACFIIITNFFYSQSIPTALYMLATLLVIATTWVHLHGQSIALKPRLRIASILLLQAIPLTLILFILFPRVQGPLWGLPQDAFASSGLDDKMAPGSLSRLILSDEVAFRVSYTDKPPRRDQMYWRGPVLWEFDGLTWIPGKTALTSAPQFTELSQPVDYSVTLEPHNKTWLFALDVPSKISVPANLTYDFRIVHNDPVKARLRYEARSHLGYRANLRENERQIQRALQLPLRYGGAEPSGARGAARQLLPQTADFVSNVSQLPPSLNPRAQQLAATWRTQAEAAPPPQPSPASGRGGNRSLAGIDESIVRAALAYFNQQNFRYTLEPPPLGMHGVDDFLFGTRQGFCEHYASAFVFLMRAAHIPARVVTGYQGGEFNDVGNYYIVRQSDAHAWAEVWLAGQGWVRIDPTAAIAPARVERGLSAAVTNNAALPFMARNPPQWLLELRLNWDALANQWNQWVLGYNAERQFAFLTRLGMESVTWQKMTLNMITGIWLIIALFALFMLRHLFKRQPDRVQAAWLKLCRRLAKAGLPRAAHEGAQDYAARIAAARPDLAETMRDLATRYSILRYGAAQNEQARQEFLRRAATLKT